MPCGTAACSGTAGRLASRSAPRYAWTRTAEVRAFLLALRERGYFNGLWREESYAVAPQEGAPLLMEMERSAVPWFGVRAGGPHMTGFVRRADGLHIWVPRRSYEKPTFPGQLDNTVAGGQPAGLGLHENLVKECGEEASIPPALAQQAKAVSVVGYWNQSGQQLKPDVMTCFDLELPHDFTPRANDGEVHSFELWPARRVFETVRDTTEFKYNCNLVLIDFFVRHACCRPTTPTSSPSWPGCGCCTLRATVQAERRPVVSNTVPARPIQRRVAASMPRHLPVSAILVLAASFAGLSAMAQDGHHGQGHVENHDWYQKLKRPGSNASCCSGTINGVEGDCRPTRAYQKDDGTWFALLDGRWVMVPPKVVLHELAPTGAATSARTRRAASSASWEGRPSRSRLGRRAAGL